MTSDTTGTPCATGTLDAIVDAHGPLPLVEALRMGADVAEALAARHDYGRPHREVRPGRVRRVGPGPWVLEPPAVDRHGRPTVADDAALPGDVLGLGSVLVFSLTGRPPSDSGPGPGEPPFTALTASADETGGDHAPGGAGPAGVPRSVPDLMAAVLDLLRNLLDEEPGRRPSADRAAQSLRRLRRQARDLGNELGGEPGGGGRVPASSGTSPDAGRVPAPSGDVPTTGVGGVSGAAAPGPGGPEASVAPLTLQAGRTRRNLRPVVTVSLAVVTVVAAVASVVRRDTVPVDVGAPVTPSTVLVAAPQAPTTTSTLAPPPVNPDGTVTLVVDLLGAAPTCGLCTAELQAAPTASSAVVGSLRHGSPVRGRCQAIGDRMPGPDGFTGAEWIFVTAAGAEGYLPLAVVGRRPVPLPICRPRPAPSTATTRRPPATVTTRTTSTRSTTTTTRSRSITTTTSNRSAPSTVSASSSRSGRGARSTGDGGRHHDD